MGRHTAIFTHFKIIQSIPWERIKSPAKALNKFFHVLTIGANMMQTLQIAAGNVRYILSVCRSEQTAATAAGCWSIPIQSLRSHEVHFFGNVGLIQSAHLEHSTGLRLCAVNKDVNIAPLCGKRLFRTDRPLKGRVSQLSGCSRLGLYSSVFFSCKNAR